MSTTRQMMEIELLRLVQNALSNIDKELTAMLDELHDGIFLITAAGSRHTAEQIPEMNPKLESTSEPEAQQQANSESHANRNFKSKRRPKPRSRSHKKTKN